jgi:hypothetical protein
LTARALGLLALFVAGSRLFFLPPTLEDIDSVNFALALEEFDPTLHQPQPPGYPVLVAFARLAHAVFAEPEVALSVVSALSQVALVPVLYGFFRFFCASPLTALLATALTLANPVLWMSGVRPMSDSLGLLVTFGALTLLLSAPRSRLAFLSGALLAGVAPGARLQSVLLCGPALVRSWLARRTGRIGAAFALVVGTLLWLVPVAVASGGLVPYWSAFHATMSEAASWEPLLRDPSLNRIVRTLVLGFFSPWGSRALGSVVLALATVGLVACAKRKPEKLRVALLVFAPYVLLHLLVQNVQAVRYSVLYLPLVSWLAVEGLVSLASFVKSRRELALATGTACLFLASAAVALPALLSYGASPSPIYAALDEADRIAAPRDGFLLTGHYLFSRYYPDRPEDLELLRPEPRRELSILHEYWRTGGVRKVLFLSDPARTDLSSLSSEAHVRRGTWSWPDRLSALLSGDRPARVELVELSPPLWFTGAGWLLSLESSRLDDLASFSERVAHLRPLDEPTFLLIAGEPLEPADPLTLEIGLDGDVLAETSAAAPLLRGFRLPAHRGRIWRNLVVRTKRDGVPEGAALALRDLEYGPARTAGVVHGEGWFAPERDEEWSPFRWVGPDARSLVHVPEDGTTMVLEGLAPTEYFGGDVSVKLSVNGVVKLARNVGDEREFRLAVTLPRGGAPFQEVRIEASRSFVPDRFQRNGDRRELALRIYEVRFLTEEAVTVSSASP